MHAVLYISRMLYAAGISLTWPPWKMKTKAAPSAVIPQVNSVPIKDCTNGCNPLSIVDVCLYDGSTVDAYMRAVRVGELPQVFN